MRKNENDKTVPVCRSNARPPFSPVYFCCFKMLLRGTDGERRSVSLFSFTQTNFTAVNECSSACISSDTNCAWRFSTVYYLSISLTWSLVLRISCTLVSQVFSCIFVSPFLWSYLRVVKAGVFNLWPSLDAVLVFFFFRFWLLFYLHSFTKFSWFSWGFRFVRVNFLNHLAYWIYFSL